MRISGLLRPLAYSKLAVTHIHQFPVFRTHNAVIPTSFASVRHSRHKARRHIVIVRRMSVPEHGMLHQPRNTPCQRTLLRTISTVPDKNILNALPELQHRRLGRIRLCKVVCISQHLCPVVAVQIVHRATGSDEEVSLVAEGSEDLSDACVEMWVEARVHADDCRGRAFFWKHADQDQICIVNPIECIVWSCIHAAFAQCFDALFATLEVRVELVVGVFAGMHVCDGGFDGLGVHGYVDAVCAPGVPVRSHHDNALEAVAVGFVATCFPVVGRARLLAEHHGRTMGEEMNWRYAHIE
jgi:hypothetical protein